MNKKKVLGICIPYYKNSEECEREFRILMGWIMKQLTDDMILYVYEDGQVSDWLWELKKGKPNFLLTSDPINKGVAHARNVILDELIDKVLYILFLDSDDYIDEDYLTKMYEYCADNSHDITESTFYVNSYKQEFIRDKVRSGVAGSALKTNIIGKHRFNEKLQIAEDTNFMNDVCDLSKHRKKHCPTTYYYQLGINPNSLIKRYERNEIKQERESEKNGKRNSKNKSK